MGWECPCGASNTENHLKCRACNTPVDKALAIAAGKQPERPPLLPIVTTHAMEGFTIQAYRGIVTAEIVMGIHMFKDLGAGLRDIFGGRSGGYQDELRKGKVLALQELSAAAREEGANAVVGASLDYEAGLGNMLMIVAKGTAVTIERTPQSSGAP